MTIFRRRFSDIWRFNKCRFFVTSVSFYCFDQVFHVTLTKGSGFLLIKCPTEKSITLQRIENDWLVIAEPACVCWVRHRSVLLDCIEKENTKHRKKNISSFILMSDGIDKNYDFKIFDSVFHFIEIPDSDKIRLKNIYC